jgi:hypothetical protein
LQKPSKARLITDFLVNDLPKANPDFTRLKSSELIVPLFVETQNSAL